MGQKLERKDVKIFCSNPNDATQVTTFLTGADTTPDYSDDINNIQNEYYTKGWLGKGNDDLPQVTDMNGVMRAESEKNAYLYQAGIPEWYATTEYFKDSFCQVAGVVYKSLTDNNLNNNPTTDGGTNWDAIPFTAYNGENIGTGEGLYYGKTLANDLQFKTLSVTGNGNITASEDTVTISIGGGETGTVYWGAIDGTLSNQSDLQQQLDLKQNLIGYTPENTSNKVTTVRNSEAATNTAYPTELATRTAINDAISNIPSPFTFNSPLSVNSDSEVSISQANSTTSGYLSSSDWNTFNGKQSTVSATSPLSITSNNISINQAGTSTSGYLSSSDWNTFNGKQGAITANSPLSLSSNTLTIAKATTSANGYLSSSDFTTFNNKVSANNSTITIQLNGSNVDSFTTNASSNKTINIANVIKSDGNYLSTQDIRTNLITENITPRNVGQTCELGSSSKAWNTLYVKYVDLSNGNSSGVVCKDAAGNKQSGFYGWMGKGGRLYVNGTEVGGCDRKIKSEIKDLNSGLETLLQLTPVSFKRNYDEDTRAGFIAQDLLGIYDFAVLKPDCKEGTYGLDQLSLIALQTKAIQELSEKVEKLETRIEVLEKGETEK